MFSGLRLRLTLLYFLVVLTLLALIGGGTYALLGTYFASTTDRTLQYAMAREFQLLGVTLPPELAEAQRAWRSERTHLQGSTRDRSEDHDEGEDEERDDGEHEADEHALETAYNGDLAAVFVVPLAADGRRLPVVDGVQPALLADGVAAAVALAQGSDWRTVRLPGGARVRLLTYRLPEGASPAALQVGRVLADQDRVLQRLWIGLLSLDAASAVALGIGSWWLAGRALRPAEQAWERQQTFVANASHELRTPLTLLRASAEVALRGLRPEDTDTRELLGDVLQECDHMRRLVDDLLLLVRLDAGHLRLEREALALPDLLADVQRQMARAAAERDVQLTLDGGSGLVWGDPTRLRQVLLILLDNALRHTPARGTIHIAAHPAERQTAISIADTGSGIAPEHLPHVFERFYRADGARTGAGSGSGLGLAIAKTLVEAQQGQIAIASRVGDGTRVTVTLPTA